MKQGRKWPSKTIDPAVRASKQLTEAPKFTKFVHLSGLEEKYLWRASLLGILNLYFYYTEICFVKSINTFF